MFYEERVDGAVLDFPIFSMFLEKRLQNSRKSTDDTGLLETR